jgi:hypothetical protein
MLLFTAEHGPVLHLWLQGEHVASVPLSIAAAIVMLAALVAKIRGRR